MGDHKHWTGDPRTQNVEGCVALQQLDIVKVQLYSQSLPMLQAQTTAALYAVVMHTEGIAYNK